MNQRFLQPPGLPFLEIRTTIQSIMPYAAHFHLGFSLGIITEGQTHFYLDGHTYNAVQGDLVLIEPDLVHNCNPVNGQPRSYHMLIFDKAWFTNAMFMPQGKTPIRPVLTNPTAYAQAKALISAIQNGTATENMLASFLHTVLTIAQVPYAPVHDNVTDLEKSLFSKVGSISHTTVSDLAAKARMRRESFSRYVRRKTVLPPQSYLHCLRIEKARRLLRQGKSIAEVALETGYVDQSHFHRMFRRIVCATPGCYQKQRSH